MPHPALKTRIGRAVGPARPSCDRLTIRRPYKITRRSGRKALISRPDECSSAFGYNVNSAVVTALARPFRWRKLIETEVYDRLYQLACAERISSSYVSQIIRLTLLASEFVEAILERRKAQAGDRRSDTAASRLARSEQVSGSPVAIRS